MRTCPNCRGCGGYCDDHGRKTCPKCKGEGRVKALLSEKHAELLMFLAAVLIGSMIATSLVRLMVGS